MEKKQTAIEWLKDKLPSIFIDDKNGFYRKLFDQALAMEREQHGTTWDDALKQVEKRTVWARAMCDFDEYYEETYKK
jgi:hypothetical protein